MSLNDFIQNSDFLSIAHDKKTSFSIYFPSVTITGREKDINIKYFDISIPKGAIIRSYVKDNNSDWYLGNYYSASWLSPQGSSYHRGVSLVQLNENRLKIESACYYNGPDTVTIPAVTLEFEVALFFPPNVF